MKSLLNKSILEHITKNGMSAKLEDNDLVINCNDKPFTATMTHSDGSISTVVTNTDTGKEIDNYDVDISGLETANDIQEELIKATDIFKAISEADLDDYTPNNDDDSEDINVLNEEDEDTNEDIVTEGNSDIPSGLKTVHGIAQDLGDKLRALSATTDDVEMVSIIMDLANSAYSLAIDIDDAYQSYVDMLQDDTE